jgi:hypothetical protein
MDYAPVVFFTYNRLKHMCRVIDALSADELASDTDLICYSDGFKNEIDELEVQKVRATLRGITGFKSITVIERDCNWGLADNIIDGVTTVVNNYGKIIVLEDDIVPGSFFLRYMNNSLNRYAEDKQVMHISAYMAPVDPGGLPESFFLRVSSCWGWGTWARAWRYFSRDARLLIETFTLEDIHSFNLNNSFNYWDQILANHHGTIKTWAVFWYASIFLAKGFCLYPRSSLVRNIGHDGSGTHCQKNTVLQDEHYCYSILGYPLKIIENTLATERYKKYLMKTFQSTHTTDSHFNKFYNIIRQIIKKFRK